MPEKLRSSGPDWLRFNEYVPSTCAENRFFRTGPLHCRLDLTLFGAVKSSEKKLTFGAALENTVPVVPSAHRDGMDDVLDAYASQSGTGAAAPIHVSC